MRISETMVSLFVGLSCWVGIIMLVFPYKASLIAFYVISIITMLLLGIFVAAYTGHIITESRTRKQAEAALKEEEIAKRYLMRLNPDHTDNVPKPDYVPQPPKPSKSYMKPEKPTQKKSAEQVNDDMEV